MSQLSSDAAHAAHHDHGDHDHDDGIPHVSAREYLTGFVLSLVLTAIPFALVMGKGIQHSTTLAVVLLAFAAVQIVVHMVYFLHMNTRSEGGWNLLALVFTERADAIAHWRGLMDAGVYTNVMVPPATPAGLSIVRISLSAAHSDEDISRIVEAFRALAKRPRPSTAA